MAVKKSGHLKRSVIKAGSGSEELLQDAKTSKLNNRKGDVLHDTRKRLKRETTPEDVLPRDIHTQQGISTPNNTQGLAVKPGISRDEMNLAEFPLTVLSTRASPGIKTLEFSDTVRGKNGEVINRQWIITGADKFGLPTSSDDEVLLGLLKLTVDDGIVNRKVFFTRYELLKALRWTTEGRSYSRLQKALDRLSGVRIKATNAFYDNDLKNHSTKNFGLIDEYEINNGKDADVRPSFFVWSDVLFKSFQVGFIKKLDLDFYLNLNSAVSKRLYRYLDKHFWYKQVVKINVFTLAHEKVGVSRTYRYLSSLRQQLDPALDELIGLGFVSKYEYSGKGEGAEVSIFSGSGEPRSALPGRENKPSHADGQSFANTAPYSAEFEDLRRKGPSSPSLKDTTQGQIANFGFGENNKNLSSREELKPLSQSALLAEVDNPSEQYRTVFQRLWADLIRRGFNEKQVNKLLSGRAKETLSRVEKIIEHCDKQLGSEAERRNPLGFLYRAIENPNQFVLPSDNENKLDLENNVIDKKSRDNLYQSESRQVRRSAPIGNVINNSKETRNQPHFSVTEKEAEYFSFRARELVRVRADIEESTLSEIERDVESALGKLRGMISPLRYQEALNHGIDERLAKKYSIPTFQEWLAVGGSTLMKTGNLAHK